MHRLNPAGLLGLGLDSVFTNGVEQSRCAITQQVHEALAGLAMPRLDVIRIGARKRGNHLAIIAP